MAIDPITGGEEVVGGIVALINKFVPDKNQAAAIVAAHEHDRADYAKALLASSDAEHAQEIELLKAQAATNTVEAGNSNLFVSGWRAFAGWSATVTTFGGVWCGIVMLFMGKAEATMTALTLLLGGIPVTLLFGMLGLHTVERARGVAPDQSPDGAPTPAPPRAVLVKP